MPAAAGRAAGRRVEEGGPAARRAGRGGSARRPAAQRRPAGQRTDPARRAAYDVLHAVAQRDAYANLLLPVLLTERKLTRRDAALATELTDRTLPGPGGYDAILAICSDPDLDRVDPPV